MFEIGTTDLFWSVAKKYPVFSKQPNTLKPLGYAHVVNLIDSFGSFRVLEAGHGTGSFLFNIYRDKLELWGLDDLLEDSQVDVESFENIKRVNPNVKFVKGLLGNNNSELPDNYFDMVCSISVLEHIPKENLKSVFEEAYRILKPGGIVAHSNDIYFSEDTKCVFEAYESAGFQWLKDRQYMNVVWEEWLNGIDEQKKSDMLYNVVFENPMFVAENYMWKIERRLRGTPKNHVTILSAAVKPFGSDSGKETITKLIQGEKNLSVSDEKNILQDPGYFSYSKQSHFDFFASQKYDKELLGFSIDTGYCDIKTYQELLVFSFIKQNLKKGAKILETGPSNSRVLEYFRNDYECWRLNDKSLTETDLGKIRTVKDKLGNFSRELPDNYFDLVYSTSAFIHSPEDDKFFMNIMVDNNRIMREEGLSLHCCVLLWKEPIVEIPNIVRFFWENQKMLNEPVPQLRISIDPDLFCMSEKYYSDTWQRTIKKPYLKFGKPFSYNLIWKK